MSDQSPLHGKSANLKKALIWMSENLQLYPEKKRCRNHVIRKRSPQICFQLSD